MDDTYETPRELDPNKLLEPPELGEYLAYEPKLSSLPFDQVPWQSFEKLSARLLEAVFGSKVIQAFTYGRLGQTQYGIDVIALKSGSSKQTVLQCKNVRIVKRGELRKWIEKFLSNRKCGDADHYILCLPFPVENDAKLVEEWSEQVQLLHKEGIYAELWSLSRLYSLLRDQADLVAEFFGDGIASSFCARPLIIDGYPVRYRHEFRLQIDNHFVFENETARLDIFVPDDRRPRVSASLSFARADLSGITFTIPGSTLVDWLQWTDHAKDLSKPPYASRVPGFEGRHVFCAPDVRLMLDDSELGHIHWIFKNAWVAYNGAATEIEAKWRFLRFDPIEGAQKRTFALANVSRQLWRAILVFAREHDCNQGKSDWYIFDAAPGVLKVYVETATKRLERGYHLIMYGYQEGGMIFPYEDTIILGWAPLTPISDEPIKMHPRLAWDAEYTHEWIFRELVPAVKKWSEEKGEKKNVWSGFLPKFFSPRRADVDLSSHIYSLGKLSVRSMSSGTVTLSALAEYAEVLQSFFHVYRRTAQISDQLVLTVLNMLVRLVPLVQMPDERYIRGNLHLGDGDLQAELSELIQRIPDTVSNPAYLDMSLRSLIALLRDTQELPQSERELIVDALVPLWNRMTEDRLCDSLR
ncbi:MAG TPA: hypothetical protein VFN66_10300 [Burkholderiales bacterium]|nr:hypothetical protein [Burkholderiales bacterium]